MVFLSAPLDRRLTPSRFKAMIAAAPGQVHSIPTPSNTWMFLNVRRPPFDDIRVRRALNLATDRARLVERGGGPELASPTCQFVPAAFPGYEPTARTPPIRHAAAGGPRPTSSVRTG